MLGSFRHASIDILQCRRAATERCFDLSRRLKNPRSFLGYFQRNVELHTRLSTCHRYSTSASGGSACLPKNWGQNSIFVSQSDDPYFNLSLEDMLFRKHDHQRPLLLIYRDSPSVIIGRNQNPWKEVNFHELERLGIPFIRRRSGGGTVYHDLGNTNYSIHLPRTSFDRHVTAQTVLRAVRSLGIDARVNDRNDICVGPEKISGSAYKIVNNRAYHHGTMLISTRLDTLGDLLRVKNKDRMVTKGVASVRSPVCNLQQFNKEVTHEAFTDAMIAQFKQDYGINEEPVLISDTEELRGHAEIKKGMDELPEWSWAFGQTPEFTYRVHEAFSWGQVTLDIRSKHGIVLECSGELSDALDETGDISDYVMELSRSLVGQRYGFMKLEPELEEKALATAASEAELAGVVRDVKAWVPKIA